MPRLPGGQLLFACLLGSALGRMASSAADGKPDKSTDKSVLLEHMPGASCAADVAPEKCIAKAGAGDGELVAFLTLSLDDFIEFVIDVPSFGHSSNATVRYMPVVSAALDEAQDLSIVAELEEMHAEIVLPQVGWPANVQYTRTRAHTRARAQGCRSVPGLLRVPVANVLTKCRLGVVR